MVRRGDGREDEVGGGSRRGGTGINTSVPAVLGKVAWPLCESCEADGGSNGGGGGNGRYGCRGDRLSKTRRVNLGAGLSDRLACGIRIGGRWSGNGSSVRARGCYYRCHGCRSNGRLWGCSDGKGALKIVRDVRISCGYEWLTLSWWWTCRDLWSRAAMAGRCHTA